MTDVDVFTDTDSVRVENQNSVLDYGIFSEGFEILGLEGTVTVAAVFLYRVFGQSNHLGGPFFTL